VNAGEPGFPSGLNVDWPETDFYEYYWAHQMYGTTISHLVSWALRLPLRSVRFIFEPGSAKYCQTRLVIFLAWIGVLVAIAAGIAAWILMPKLTAGWWPANVPAQFATFTALLALGLSSVWALGKYIIRPLASGALSTVVDFIGDAARYFDVAPKNIARRYDILRGGIQLLKDLHEDRDETSDQVMYRYGRVVLVGHSLGSVIAYDILRHYWGAINGRLSIEDMTAEISELEAFDGSNDISLLPASDYPKRYDDSGLYRGHQRFAFACLNQGLPYGEVLQKESVSPSKEANPKFKIPARWIVSDLVTLGSPLAHAPLLLASGINDENDGLNRKIELRELPTCPPDRSRTLKPGRFVVPLEAEAHMIHGDREILHHAAYFAITGWTNIWFRTDWIGGPVIKPFGNGIDDCKLTSSPWFFVTAHTSYWDPRRGTKSLEKIRNILLQDVGVNSTLRVF
jgi:pimeloyl-ACP methyl ester carboxylesterase